MNLEDPENIQPENNGNANSWYSGSPSPGSKGSEAALNFEAWAISNGLDQATSKTDDNDGDGIINLMEYALNSDPMNPSIESLPQIKIQVLDLEDEPKKYITFTFTRQGQSSDLNYTVEFSKNLVDWKNDTAVLESTNPNANGTVTEIWRAPLNIESTVQCYFRLKVKG